MAYEDLAKLYYSDSEHYEAIYAARFNDPQTTHFHFLINDHPAFLTAENSVAAKALHIYKTDKQVLRVCSELPGKAIEQFAYKCLVDEIILSNTIEGVHSSRKEINSVISDLESQNHKNKRFRGLVQKYLMLQNREELSFTSCTDIRRLYDELVRFEIEEDDPHNLPDGKLFRKDSASVVSATQKEIHRGVNPESAIIETMQAALQMLGDDSLEILYRVSVFHYLFGYIHPFYDGNGRTSRFISSYLLSRELEPIIGYRLSYTIKENIKSYYAAFKTCNDPHNRGDLTPFVIMFMDILDESMTQLLGALQKRLEQLQQYRGVICLLKNGKIKKYAETYDLLLQATLFSENGIRTKELLQLLDCSRSTLGNRFAEMEDGLLLRKNFGNTHCYMLDQQLLNTIIMERT